MICAICTDDVKTTVVRPLDGKLFRICIRCDTEHPRQGGYSFNGSTSENRTGVDRSIGHRSKRSPL